MINVYGPTQTIDRLTTWNEINSFIINNQNENFIIGGDFHTTTKREEKYGGIQTISEATLDFRE